MLPYQLSQGFKLCLVSAKHSDQVNIKKEKEYKKALECRKRSVEMLSLPLCLFLFLFRRLLGGKKWEEEGGIEVE